MELLFDESSRLLSQMIQAASLRHQVLSQNIANIDTPGYQAMDVSFSEELRLASAGASGSIGDVKATVTTDPVRTQRYDGNAVDLDRQMAKMAANAVWHSALVQIMNSRLNFLRTAIRGV
jgi:flagellar basal-body rod protein FlgB